MNEYVFYELNADGNRIVGRGHKIVKSKSKEDANKKAKTFFKHDHCKAVEITSETLKSMEVLSEKISEEFKIPKVKILKLVKLGYIK